MKDILLEKFCSVCNAQFTKRRPNACIKCYYKKRHKEKYKPKERCCISCGKLYLLKHNVYCPECKNDIKNCDKNHRIYFGRKFYKNCGGYWVCCRSRQPWAHRWVWINYYGKIPNNMDIHHKDGNKDNNEIENLELLTRSEHQKKHWMQGDHDHEIEIRIKTLDKARKSRQLSKIKKSDGEKIK